MRIFGANNYSYFFRDATDNEIIIVSEDIGPRDTVKGVALLSGFTAETLTTARSLVFKVNTRKVEVELNAYQGGVIREVIVAENDLNGVIDHDLEVVFKWGQNDHQPITGRCSVSSGDVIRFQNKRYKVESVGFSEVT